VQFKKNSIHVLWRYAILSCVPETTTTTCIWFPWKFTVAICSACYYLRQEGYVFTFCLFVC